MFANTNDDPNAKAMEAFRFIRQRARLQMWLEQQNDWRAIERLRAWDWRDMDVRKWR